MQQAMGAKIAAVVTSLATLAQPSAARDDALKQNGAQPAVATDPAPKATVHEMVERQVGGVAVRISASPLAVVQDADRELLSQLAGGPSIRANTGIAADRKSNEAFQNGKIATWDVTNDRPRIIGSMTLRDEGAKAVVDALKHEGYIGAALAMTHGSERGVLLLQTKDNGVFAIAYEIPSLKRDKPGTDAADSNRFKELMPGILSAMAEQNFGLKIAAPVVSAPVPGVAPAAPQTAPQAVQQAVAPLSLQTLEVEYAKRHEVTYQDELTREVKGPDERGMLVAAKSTNYWRTFKNECLGARAAILLDIDELNNSKTPLDRKRVLAARAGVPPDQALTATDFNVALGTLRGYAGTLRDQASAASRLSQPGSAR